MALRWPARPPGAWLLTTARHKAIDRARRERRRPDKQEAAQQLAASGRVGDRGDLDGRDQGFSDERLGLIFTCCHPALAEAQVALTLRTLGGLAMDEMLAHSWSPRPTMAQRLVRAKRKIRRRHIPYACRPAITCRRLDGVCGRLPRLQRGLRPHAGDPTCGARCPEADSAALCAS